MLTDGLGNPFIQRFSEEDALAWVEDCLKWRGYVLQGDHSHWCVEWDGLPVDETTSEYDACLCFT